MQNEISAIIAKQSNEQAERNENTIETQSVVRC